MDDENQGFIHIIESPSDIDLLEGTTEGKGLSEILSLAGIPFKYNLVTTKETLFIALNERLIRAIKTHECIPILHFSMHGDNNGIQLTDGHNITWEELQEQLVDLHEIMQSRLLICMSSCYGSSGLRMAMTEANAFTFSTLIGNTDEVSWEDAAVAYSTFYHSLFKNKSIEDSVKAMKIASCNDDFIFHSGERVKQGWINWMKSSPKPTIGDLLISGSQKK